MVQMMQGMLWGKGAMLRPLFCTEARGYRILQETAPKTPSHVWRMLFLALVVGKDDEPSPSSPVAVGWQRTGVEERCWGLWGGCPSDGCGLAAEAELSPPEGTVSMGSSLPAPNPGSASFLRSWGVKSWAHNVIK